MFLGPTDLVLGDYYNGRNVGTISSIKQDGNFWVFEMYNGDIYKTDKVTKMDIFLGGGDKIFIPADTKKEG